MRVEIYSKEDRGGGNAEKTGKKRSRLATLVVIRHSNVLLLLFAAVARPQLYYKAKGVFLSSSPLKLF